MSQPSEAFSARTLRERIFLLRDLPEGLTRASDHLQITDHYLTGTRLHLRKLRAPATNERAWKLRQKLAFDPQDASLMSLTEIELTRAEHQQLLAVGSREVRFNRYQHQHDNMSYDVDFFLGDLLGLLMLKLRTPVDESFGTLAAPPCAVLEVTGHPLFAADRVASLTTAEIRAELARREK